MDFIANQASQFKEMLADIGVEHIDELLQRIPDDLKLPKPLEDDGLSESEGLALMEKIAEQNTYPHFDNYLGAGAYEHHVPSLVSAICSKSEFLTAYTPYQAEASQGSLQTIFEFQSAISRLTGLPVANASVYDGASACAEALLMALRHQKGKNKILIAGSLHPHYRAVVDQYVEAHTQELVTIPCDENGRLDQAFLTKSLDMDTAAVLIQSPNFFGIVEDIKEYTALIKASGSLLILCANPLSYSLFQSAAAIGADIAIGDCQPFGMPLQYGGPYAGYMACSRELMRQIPGRLVGKSIDKNGQEGFVLTLQAREQHIRREKATSNICSNQALCALASLVAMLWYGKEGLAKLALTNYQRANYLKSHLEKLPGISIFSEAPVFNEFCVQLQQPIGLVQQHFRTHCIEPGLDLKRFFPDKSNHLLIAVTEMKSKEQLDQYIRVANEILG